MLLASKDFSLPNTQTHTHTRTRGLEDDGVVRVKVLSKRKLPSSWCLTQRVFLWHVWTFSTSTQNVPRQIDDQERRRRRKKLLKILRFSIFLIPQISEVIWRKISRTELSWSTSLFLTKPSWIFAECVKRAFVLVLNTSIKSAFSLIFLLNSKDEGKVSQIFKEFFPSPSSLLTKKEERKRNFCRDFGSANMFRDKQIMTFYKFELLR